MSKSRSVGTAFKVGSGASAKTVGGLTSILETAGKDDVFVGRVRKDLSDENGWMATVDNLPKFKDGGEVPLSGFLDGADTGQDELYSLLESGTVTPMAIIFPAAIGKTWSFNAFVKEFSTGVDIDGAIAFDVTVRVSGKPALAATASV